MNQESPSQELVPLRKRRTKISDKPNYSLNLWSIMKNCIGKELSKIPMPVSIVPGHYATSNVNYRKFRNEPVPFSCKLAAPSVFDRPNS